MCLGGKIKREKVNFAKLYEGIKNDVVRERIKSSGEWYIENAMKYKIWFWVLSIFGAVRKIMIVNTVKNITHIEKIRQIMSEKLPPNVKNGVKKVLKR